MAKRLPTRLGKEPLIEAVCELRLSPASPLHSALPGYLIAKLRAEDIGALEQLPAAMIPEPLRESSPNLAHAAVVRLSWRNYYVLIGTRVVAVACRLPYPKWPHFRPAAVELFRLVLGSPFVKGIDRYSVKYVNFFPSVDENPGNTRMMDWSIRVGELGGIGSGPTQLRVEIASTENVVTVLNIISPAQAQREGEPAEQGGVVDVDTICNHVTNNVAEFSSQLEQRLDGIRLINKQVFFDSLTQRAIDSLEPEYDDQLS